MMFPEERERAIEILVEHEARQHLSNSYSADSNFKKFLRNGFVGFSSFSDADLIRALHKLGRENASSVARDFVSGIIMDRVINE